MLRPKPLPINPSFSQLGMLSTLTRIAKAAGAVVLLSGLLLAQDAPSKPTSYVTLLPTPTTTIRRGSPGSVELRFRVGSGFHVNSNTPTEEFLIPTALVLDAPTDIVIGRVTYPAGDLQSFPFAPDQKLSVYTGEFAVSILIRPLASVLPTEYAVHGTLKYQACDKAACYPPKRLPVSFNVKIAKNITAAKSNPKQSPHAHR